MNAASYSKNAWIAYAALAVICIVWGTTFLGIRIGVANIPPFLFAGIRTSVAGLLLTAIVMVVMKAKLPPTKIIINQAIAGLFLFTLGNGLIGVAELHISSGIAAIICAMIPIWVTLINLITSENEKPTLAVFVGLAIGISGIVLMFGDSVADLSKPGYLWSIAIIFFANIGFSFGTVWIKKKNMNTTSNTFVNAGLQMFFGGIINLIVSPVVDDYSNISWTPSSLWALGYLIVVGSMIAYACFAYALKKLPVTIVSLYAYVNPIVAVLLGNLILNEKFNLRIAISMLITVAGIYIVNKGVQIKNLWKAQFSR